MKRILIILSVLLSLFFHRTTAQDYKVLKMPKQELINAGKINIYIENFDFETDIKVISYTVTGYIRAGDISIEVNGTNEFTKDVIHLIRKVHKNETICFEKIKVRLDDGTIRTLKPILVKIL